MPECFTMQVQHQMVNTAIIIQKEVHVTNSELVPLIKIATFEHVYPILRKLFTKSILNVPWARRHNSLGKNYSGSRNIIHCKKEQNPICKSPMLGENTKLDKYVKRTIFISGIGSFGNDGERSFPESSTQKRETSEQHFPCRKKGWRELNSDKF